MNEPLPSGVGLVVFLELNWWIKYNDTPSQAREKRRVELFGKSKGQDYSVLHHALRGIPSL